MPDFSLDRAVDRSPLVVLPQTPAIEAIALMSQTESSSVLVVEEMKVDRPCLLGMVTRTEVVRAIASDLDLTGLVAQDIMDANPVTLQQSELHNLDSAIACWHANRLCDLPIIDDLGRVAGAIAPRRILEILARSREVRKWEGTQERETAAVLQRKNSLLQQELERRKQAERTVRQLNAKLNRRIANKITQLETANQVLETKIAECNLLQQKIETSEQEMRSLLSGISDLVLIVDREVQNIQILPTNLDSLYAIDAGILNKTIEQFWAPGANQFLTAVQQTLDSQERTLFDYCLTFEEEENLQLGDRDAWFSAGISPIAADRVIWVARDISKRKQAEQSLRDLNQELEQRVRERTEQLQQTNEQLEAEIRDRLLAEESLREREAQLSAIAANIPGTVYQLEIAQDLSLRVLFFSSGSLELSGLAPEVAMANPERLFEFVHPEDLPQVTQNLMVAMADLQPCTQEYRIITTSGQVKWVQDITQFSSLDNGNILMDGLVLDISDRKQAEEALRESEERFRAMFEQAAIGITMCTKEGAFIEANQAFCNIIGYTEAELQPLTFIELTHPDDRQTNWEQLQLLEEEKCLTISLEKRYLHKQGHTIWANTNVSIVRDRESNSQYYLAATKNIGDRKLTEEALRESEERFRAVFEQAEIGLVMVPLDRSFVKVNQQFCEMVGYIKSELDHFPLLELTHPDDRASSLEQIQKLHRSEITSFSLEKRYLHKQGYMIWASTSASILRDSAGNPQYFLTAIQDISDRKAAEIALQDSEARLRSQQNAIVELLKYHDIYTGRLNETLSKIAEVAAQTLEVERIGIWFYNPSRTQIDQADLYELSQDCHSCGQTLDINSYPNYFCVLETQEMIAADRAQHDPRTREFLDTLLIPTGITSMMDIPIRSGGKTVGVICCEHVGTARHWTVEEQNFASYLANLVSLGLESRDRQQIEAALKKSEARYRSVVETQTELICRYRVDSTITFVNNAFCRYVNLTAEEILGLKLIQFIIPPDRERPIEHLNTLTPDNPTGTIESRSQLPNGEIRWQQWTNQALYDDRGNFIEFQGIGRDISDRKRAEVKLGATQERFQYLLASNPSTIYTCHLDDDYPATFISSNVEELLGYSSREFLANSRFWVEHIHPEDRETLLDKISSLLLRDRFACEYRFLHREGTYRWLRDDVKLVRDGAGNPLEAVGSLIDVSDRKRAEAEVLKALDKERELVELKSRFISMTSHEFRTPLTAIKSSAQLLIRYDWSQEEELQHLQQIETSVGHMTALLEDILTLSRSEAGKFEFKPTSIELADFCRNLVRELQIGAGKSEYAIDFCADRGDLEAETEPENCEIPARMDEKLLRQILSNLLSNAIKYSPAEKRIAFSLYCQPKWITFQVQDFGIGIPAAEQSHLFESFYRAKNVGTIPGTGLGLSIVKRLVELHGGAIDFRSQPGEGTIFSVTLPRFSG